MNPVGTARDETSNATWRMGASLAVAIAIGVAALVALQPAPAKREAAAVSPRPQGLTPSPALRATRSRPVRFETNLGQAATGARFIAHGQDFSAQIFDDGVALRRTVRNRADESNAIPPAAEARLRFIGARTAKAFDARERAEGTTNYMIGADASKWLHDVPSYRQLRQAGLYPGIDLVYYGHDSAFEYDLVVQPGADASRIRIAVASGARPVIDVQGDLLLDGADGSLRMHRPVLYQHIAGEKKVLDGEYVMLATNEVGFRLPAYDHTRPLIIDPTFKLLYSTYLGGVHDDQVGGMTLDGAGNAYVVGNSGSEDWPVSGNAFQTTRKAIGRYVRNVVVTKFDASGTLIYSTFIGGTTNDYGNSIAVDAAGRAYIAGVTNSSDFPVTAGAFQSAFRGNQSAYLAVLSSDGGQLAYSSLYGGSGGASAMFVGLDTGGKIVIGGSAGTGLPTTTGAYMTSLALGSAAFVARFDIAAQGAAQLLAASYYGAATPQTNFLATGNAGYTLALDAAGSPWITGQAWTSNLPVTANAARPSPVAMTPSCSPGSVPLNSFAYVAHLSADLSTLAYASYLSGGNGGPATCAEYGHGLAFDAAGNVYVGGSTSSLSYPTTAGALQPMSPANSGFDGYAGFITKLTPDGSAIVWSTYLGGNRGRTYLSGLTADSNGGLWAYAGSAGGSNFPISADALQKTHGGGTFDASFTRLDASSGAMLYSTFMGGPGDDAANAFAVDPTGNAYVAGATNSTNFPTTADAFQAALTANAYDGADWFFSILGSGTIGKLSVTSGGNAGDVTLVVHGAGFQAGATCALSRATGAAISVVAGVGTDGTQATCVLPLDGAVQGVYDVVIGNPDGSSVTKAQAFTVQAGGAPNLSVQIIGRSKIRTGVASRFVATVINAGNQDAYGIPLWLTVPNGVTTAGPAGSLVVPESGFAPPDGKAQRLHVFIPKIAAGDSYTVPLDLTATTDAATLPLNAELQAPWFRSVDQAVASLAETSKSPTCVVDAAHPAYADCSGLYYDYGLASLTPLASAHPASGAGATAGTQSLSGRARPLFDNPCQPLVDAYKNGHEAGRQDGLKGQFNFPNNENRLYNIGYTFGFAVGVTQSLSAGQGSSGAANVAAANRVHAADESCPVKPTPPPPMSMPAGGSGGGTSSGGSIDPNDKTGPSGDGSPGHFIRKGAPFSYQIAFENQPTASLPAARVVVTDQLDPARYDLTTLTLGAISFGSQVVNVPRGLQSYSTVFAIDATMSVRIQGSLDSSSGRLTWTFDTIDPLTHLPPSDPTLGFLPPDTDGKRGQGYVAFSVLPKAGLADGTVISNLASVVFDANAPILTPTWTNTIDATLPTSRIQSLVGKPGTTSFDVAWSGNDAGAGVANYTIYVSDNGAPFVAWQTAVATSSSTYVGVSGHSYGFYSQAGDGAGNGEGAKSAAEATIAVSGAFPDPTVGTSGSSGGCTIGGDGQRDASLPLLVIIAGGLLLIVRRRAATKRRREED